MNDQIKAAFTSATETVKNTLTLASAILTVSVTFLKDVNDSPNALQVYILEGSWGFLLVAIIACITTLMAITGTLAKATSVEGSLLYRNNIKIPMAIALGSFLIGITLTATYGMSSV